MNVREESTILHALRVPKNYSWWPTSYFTALARKQLNSATLVHLTYSGAPLKVHFNFVSYLYFYVQPIQATIML